MKKKPEIFVICPSVRDRRHLLAPKLFSRYRIRFFGDYVENPEKFYPTKFFKKIFKEFKKSKPPDGVIATDDFPAAFVASILSHRFKRPGPSPESVFLCQHKYYSRLAQRESIPETVPPFALVPLDGTQKIGFPPLPLPFFIKPVKGHTSILSRSISTRKEFYGFLKKARKELGAFAQPFDRLIQETHLKNDFSIGGKHLIAEGLLSGHQITLEGYVYKGKVYLIDIVDSVFYPGTLSFKRFQSPSHLPRNIQEKMFQLTKRFLKKIDFNNSLFNAEYIYDSKRKSIHLLEINSRMAPQFAGMMEALHGTNPYEVLIQLSLGKKPKFQRSQGDQRVAASFVLRKFKDLKVVAIPSQKQIEEISRLYPRAEIEILVKAGQKLSNRFRQDEESFRYAIINLSAESEKVLFRKFEEIKKRLSFRFSK